MKGRIKENDSSVPAIDGPWAYYRRFREGGEYPLFARRPAAHAFDSDPGARTDPARRRRAGGRAATISTSGKWRTRPTIA